MDFETRKTSDENLKNILRELKLYRTRRRALPRELANKLYELAASVDETKPLASRNLQQFSDPLLPQVTINLRDSGFEREASSGNAVTSIDLANEYQVIRVLLESTTSTVVFAQERPYIRAKYGEEDQRPRYIALVQTESNSANPTFTMHDLYDGVILSQIHGETTAMNDLRCSAFQAA